MARFEKAPLAVLIFFLVLQHVAALDDTDESAMEQRTRRHKRPWRRNPLPDGRQPSDAHSRVRCVFQTKYGDIHFTLFPEVAPVTAQHIFKLVTMGAYIGNHFFRVDKGFVAQVAEVTSGRLDPLNSEQKVEAKKKVPLEVKPDVKHVAGVLSMGRFDDPNSGTSSFSILLGNAPHLDNQYTIFGKVTSGMEVLRQLETLETRREGIFVMPKERITITGTYWYVQGRPFGLTTPSLLSAAEDNPGGTTGLGSSYCDHLQDDLDKLRSRYNWQAEELQRVRAKCLPG